MTDQAVAQAAESASLTRARFEQELALSKQLIDAETALVAARVRRAEAEADRQIAIAALRKALNLAPTGIPSESEMKSPDSLALFGNPRLASRSDALKVAVGLQPTDKRQRRRCVASATPELTPEPTRGCEEQRGPQASLTRAGSRAGLPWLKPHGYRRFIATR